ncbi:MAG: hypothetical protein IPP43_07170 [Chitinophagaceae bacterium]|nr:hypothetical protein [Chitinophagaceae bacterium]
MEHIKVNALQTYPPENSAKGAPANGGGGGNNHNNSGGGGANLTIGGNGGGNSSSGPIGCNITNNWGRGGKALSSWGGTKIFWAEEEAGHSNNGSPTTNFGGNGGGIIFIWANNLLETALRFLQMAKMVETPLQMAPVAVVLVEL